MKINIENYNGQGVFKKRIGEGKIFITGFYGVGAVGYLVSKYLTMQKEAKYLGYISTKRLPMIIRMEDNRIGLPFELYQWKNYIILLNESIPDAREIHAFSDMIVDWVIENKFKLAVLFGGLAERVGSQDPIRIAYTRTFPSVMKPFAPALEKRLSIVGPLALLLSGFEMKGFPSVCILPYAKVYEYDLNAAYMALKVLKEKFAAEIDLTQLEKDLSYEKKIESDILKELEKSRQPPPPDSKILYM
ncbi:MAG TPA: PAC2 family protein [Geobacterales bacterium]|nr:PAC2 family protein [Geobacterales bacterium]